MAEIGGGQIEGLGGCDGGAWTEGSGAGAYTALEWECALGVAGFYVE